MNVNVNVNVKPPYVIITILIMIIFTIGWIANIVQIAHAKVITGMVIIKVVAIFIAPLGSILGWAGL